VPEPILFDEFPSLPCDDLLGRTDAFLAELMREPNTRAVILIYKPTVNAQYAAGLKKVISSDLQFHGFEMDRVSFYKSETSPDGDLRTKFFKLPPGAEAPVSGFEKWPDETHDTSRAFMFGYVDEANECPTYVPRAFAKIILDNPGSRGHIVVKTSKDHLVEPFSFADGFIKELVERQGLPRKRLRLFFARDNETLAEFWFVPAKMK